MNSVNHPDSELVRQPDGASVMPAMAFDKYASPQHIRAVSRLYGVQAPALEKARVMVLGCGTGLNLLPFCHAWPEATVTGIDLDGGAVAQGKAMGDALPANLELHTLALDELVSCDPGMLDYIIIDGLYRWLSNDIRAELLQFCQQHLAEDGVIAVRWPCWPGSRSDETLRDAMLFHGARATSVEEQIGSARAMTSLLALSPQQKSALHPFLQQSETASDAELTLKYLSDMNNACYLIDFNSMVENQGLALLGDAQPWSEIPEHYGADIARLLHTVCPDGNKIISQQYLDFMVNRRERFSLLVKQQQKENILPQPDKAALKFLNWAGSFTRVLLTNKNSADKHVTPDGNILTTQDETSLKIFDVLGDAWPVSLTFDQLVHLTAPLATDDNGHEEKILNILNALFIQGMKVVDFCLGTSPYQHNAFPEVNFLPGLADIIQPDGKKKLVYNFWHHSVVLEAKEAEFISERVPDIDNSSLLLMKNLKRKGLLTGSIKAWQQYFCNMIAVTEAEDIAEYVCGLFLFSYHLDTDDKAPENGQAASAYLNYFKKNTADKKWAEVSKQTLNKIDKLLAEKRGSEALAILLPLADKNEDNPEVWHEIAKVQLRTNFYKESLESIKKTFVFSNKNILIFSHFAMILLKNKILGFGERLCRYCLYLNGSNVYLWSSISIIAADRGDFINAENYSRKTIELSPNNTLGLATYGRILIRNAKIGEAIEWLRKAYQSDLNNFNYFTNYLFALTHDPHVNAEYLFAEQRRFGRTVERWVRQQSVNFPHLNVREKQRPLRIGFVSGDLGKHPVTNFFRPVWDDLDVNKFHLYVYHTSMLNDEVTQQLKEKANSWQQVVGLSHVELARLIHKDKIDILIDLSGHTDYNRLPAFALKPAPVAISCIGYPGSTGLKEMDYYIIPDTMDSCIEAVENQFTEKLIALSWGKMFSVFQELPEIKSLPVLKNGYFTYGSFNRPSKINETVIACWCDVLRSVPDSRMLIGAMPSDQLIEIIREKMVALGIDAERLIFRKKAHLKEYMEMHNEVDVLLDTFPYTGGTTTNYGLQMGVPTLTQLTGTYVSYQGAATLRKLGLDDYVTESREEYIARAVALATDYAGLAELRATVRERLENVEQQQTSNACYFEKMLHLVWQRYCDDQPVEHLVINMDE